LMKIANKYQIKALMDFNEKNLNDRSWKAQIKL
jgi:hypothetical protein